MKRLLSVFLCLTIALSCLLGLGVTAKAVENNLNADKLSGNTPMSVTGTAISKPGYTVTIPKTVTFGEIKRTSSKNVVTKSLEVSANGISNLFANQQRLVVTVSSKNGYKLSDGSTTPNMLSYNFYSSYTDETTNIPISNGLIFEVEGTAHNDTNLTAKVDGVISFNTSDIKKAGTYSDILTFTVALQEVSVK